ncbi:MAG: hypothetical protein WB607_00050 [Candidatus Acidiferrum sp.]
MNHEIYLRCHTRILDDKPQENRKVKKTLALPRYVLVLDTETIMDARQSLNFGAYQFCEADSHGNYSCREEGLFHADDLPGAKRELLRRYVANENRKKNGSGGKLKLYNRSAFVEKVMNVAIQADAVIVAFNLPFDLSRLAVMMRKLREQARQRIRSLGYECQ